jgi:NCS1 family nucleobase:cation symporter-1
MLGNLIVLVPMVLNGHPGTRYGVPFPVMARAAFGILPVVRQSVKIRLS